MHILASGTSGVFLQTVSARCESDLWRDRLFWSLSWLACSFCWSGALPSSSTIGVSTPASRGNAALRAGRLWVQLVSLVIRASCPQLVCTSTSCTCAFVHRPLIMWLKLLFCHCTVVHALTSVCNWRSNVPLSIAFPYSYPYHWTAFQSYLHGNGGCLTERKLCWTALKL